MSKQVSYRVVKESAVTKLETGVEQLMTAGYEVHGPLQLATSPGTETRIYIQAMVKTENEWENEV